MKSIIFSAILLLVSLQMQAQVLDCDCSVNAPSAQTTDPEVFKTMEKQIAEFMNGTGWIDDQFQQEERIKCNIVLNIIEELSGNGFRAELLIQGIRPVYGSTYVTPIFSFSDPFVNFTYAQFQQIEYSQAAYLDNLSSILSYYAYLIIGLDYDSFSPFGGEEYLLEAQRIVNSVPQNVASSVGGWSSSENGANRFWIIENLLSPRVKPMRKAFYDYHRQGLDVMASDTEAGVQTVMNAVSKVDEINRAVQNSAIVRVFTATKANELIEIFKGADRNQQAKMVKMMSAIDPANATKYRAIRS